MRTTAPDAAHPRAPEPPLERRLPLAEAMEPHAAPSPSRTGRPSVDVVPTPPRPRRRRLLLLVPILLLVGGAAVWLAYRSWYDSTYFVVTDNAQVSGDLVQVGSLNAGRILATRVDIGDRVQRDQEIALVGIPQQVALPFGGASRVEETGAADTRVPVRSPLSGVVVARSGHTGATVAAGQPIYSLIDPARVWIRANIEETRVARVMPGHKVEVFVDALGQTFLGTVVSITPASAGTFSLLPAQNVSGNYVRVTQLVPVKIQVDSGGAVLPIGTSATVRIQVRQPDGGLPWHP